MNILITNRNAAGYIVDNALKRFLEAKGHDVSCYSRLFRNGELSEYDVVIAHPKKYNFRFLYEEADKRKDFKLIFFNTKTLESLDPSSQFKNNNVFFERKLPQFSRLLEIINS